MSISDSNDPLILSLPTVHEAVRKSHLINVLHEKLKSLPVGAFPFALELGRLRDVIAPQIGDTRILFPEFTPHDEPLHVGKLFQLADNFFGSSYQQLNAAELFLLGCALYAHDWGMAIGQQEKEYLCHGTVTDCLCDSFTPLPDEAERLDAFIRAEGLQRDTEGKFPVLSEEHLRLYVRATHARRSGARVRAHFHEHPAIGEAIAHVCEGHWHDFATLDDPNRFHHEYEVAGQTTHVLAIALQVRLIDLFHITEDRTPYALWRFVSPVDRKSEEEWKKHRALHAVTAIDFSPGRAIKIQGFTEDEEVWASLQDLRSYCEDQLNRTLNLSARHVPERYKLNFLKLEWAVTTGALLPVNFSFGFDSRAMFRILSDDIYDGDSYVFLRELLQNSIDAIRTRLSRYEQRAKNDTRKKRTSQPFDTTIYFKVDHQRNGDILVSCRDYGVGMDEHVIRNYFTVAGVSYYRSSEFERKFLGFEPISRFGIGILSCFMVADSLEVKTYRDSECGPVMVHADSKLHGAAEHCSRRLHLRIPAVERQFIVKDLLDNFEVGTEVLLKVLKKKMKQQVAVLHETEDPLSGSDPELEFKRSLEITEYLCDIAGFVKFPICVEESWPGQDSPNRTLILHPKDDAEKERAQFTQDLVVHQLCPEYPWEKVVRPECHETSREMMAEHRFDLQEILGDTGYEGWVIFPVPKFGCDFVEPGLSVGRDHVVLRKRDGDQWVESLLFWERLRFHNKEVPRYLFGVYRDGVLLGGIKLPEGMKNRYLPMGVPQMHINLSSSASARPNVSRTTLTTETDSWFKPIWTAIMAHLQATEILDILALPLEERLYRLGWCLSVFPFTNKEMTALVPDSQKVSVWLIPPGKLFLREGKISCGVEIPQVPKEMGGVIAALCAQKWRFPHGLQADFEWEGLESVLENVDEDEYFSVESSFSQPLISGLRLATAWATMVNTRVQFLEPPAGCANLLLQNVGVLDEDALDGDESTEQSQQAQLIQKRKINALLTKAIMDPMSLDHQEIRDMIEATFFHAVIPIPFSTPFAECVASDESMKINKMHPIGIAIFRCIAACSLAVSEKRLSAAVEQEVRSLNNGCFPDQFSFVFAGGLQTMKQKATISLGEYAARLFAIVEQNQLINGFVSPTIPDPIDYVPKITSLSEFLSDTSVRASTDNQNLSKFKGPFGKLINEWPLPHREI